MNLPIFISPWLANLTPDRAGSRRLFMFPFAGAGPIVFRPWVDRLPADWDIYAVQFPGRGTRIREKPSRRLEPLVTQLDKELRPYLDVPFSFFGHSLGVLVAFELARGLRRSGMVPEQLLISGYPAPHLPFPYHHLHNLSSTDFIQEMRILSGTPQEVLDSPDFLELVIPIVQADFEVLETYTYLEERPFEFPIHVMGGNQDPIARREHLEAWRGHTDGPFTLTMFEGNHFYFEQRTDRFLRNLCRYLESMRAVGWC